VHARAQELLKVLVACHGECGWREGSAGGSEGLSWSWGGERRGDTLTATASPFDKNSLPAPAVCTFQSLSAFLRILFQFFFISLVYSQSVSLEFPSTFQSPLDLRSTENIENVSRHQPTVRNS
jgi:hypothetical protein